MLRRLACVSLFTVVSTAGVGFVEAQEPATIGRVTVLAGPQRTDASDTLAAALRTPFAAVRGRDGVIWVVEYDGGRILQLSEDGSVDFIAGSERRGLVDGRGETVRFNQLHNLAMNHRGMIYLSDHRNHVVRRLEIATGVVSTLAGTGEPGFGGDGGSISTCQFQQPISVAASRDGQSLYVADIGNRRIRAIDLSNETIRTIAGTGRRGEPVDGAIAVESPLVDPRCVAEDRDGNLWIVERGGHALRVIRDGRIYTVAGTGKPGYRDGAAMQAMFRGPKHVDVADDGRVYIADDNNHAIRVYDPDRRSVETLDLDGFELERPHGVSVDGESLLIADSFHNRILSVLIEDH
ncbi:MAG: hypothetical protein AAF670_02215 [Planctomycetota bacterium]